MPAFNRFLLLALSLLLQAEAVALFVQVTVVNAGCGNATGACYAQVIGGSPPFTYLWSTGGTTDAITGLAPGTYTVDVWDAMASTGNASGTVLALPGLDVLAAVNAGYMIEACSGGCNGQLVISEWMLGGQVPYVFNTLPPMPLNAICGDAPFNLTVTDALGCVGTASTVVPEQVVPSMIGTSVNGPCGGAPTSVVYAFDAPFPTGGWWTGPGGSASPNPGTVSGNSYTIPSIMPGVYTYTIPQVPPCTNLVYSFFFPGVVTDCANVSGDLFLDVDADCANTGADFLLANRMVAVVPGAYVGMTDAIGHYGLSLPYGTYDLSCADPYYTQSCPVASPVNFTVDAITPTATIDLAFTAGTDPDVAIACMIGQAVPGFAQTCYLSVVNNGAVPSGPVTVTLDHDPLLTYAWTTGWCYAGPGLPPTYAYGFPVSFISGQVTWQLPDGLDPLEQKLLRADLYVPPDPLLIGTDFNYTAVATTALNDFDLTNNVCLHTETVVGSFDPNDKHARTTSGSDATWSPTLDSNITYTIRFQNTGTAAATTVVVTDTLSALLDLSSLRILGASHRFSARFDPGNVLRFTFDHIMLPDSGSNESGSHGLVQFAVQPIDAVMPGQAINNAADIFFDFNPPVRTNTSTLVVDMGTALSDPLVGVPLAHPNPATDLLMIRSTSASPTTATIYAADGRLVQGGSVVGDRVMIGGLRAGTYVLVLTDPQGVMRRARFVKR